MAIERIFKSERIQANWFDPRFLSLLQISPPQIQHWVVGFKGWLGNYRGVRQVEGREYLVLFERGTIPGAVRLNASGQIERLQVRCPRTTATSLGQAPRDLQQLLVLCPNLR